MFFLSCLQNSRKSHESIIRGGGGRGVSPKHFVRKSVKEAKFHKMCHFKILAWKVKKDHASLTYVTQESQTFSQKLFTEKSKSQSSE